MPDDLDTVPPAAVGSAAEAVGDEALSIAVDLPWDEWLGAGASDQVRDGSLAVVRHAYPAGAARDLRAAGTAAGLLDADPAARERITAVGLGIAASRHRPARMPHAAGSEPHAWWVAEERTLVWLPWAGEDAYGLELLETRQADAVTVVAPDACWTVFSSGLPPAGARGGWDELPPRLRRALLNAAPGAGPALVACRWFRRGDTVSVRWPDGSGWASARLEVGSPAAR